MLGLTFDPLHRHILGVIKTLFRLQGDGGAQKASLGCLKLHL